MSEYQPGQVAIATVRGVKNVRVMLDADRDWTTGHPVGGYIYHGDWDLTDLHPLVTLDLGARADEFAILLREVYRSGLESIAAQVEAQTKPVRIDEPGLWGVVEAGVAEYEGRHLFGNADGAASVDGWWGPIGWRLWEELIDPVLIRDGVS